MRVQPRVKRSGVSAYLPASLGVTSPRASLGLQQYSIGLHNEGGGQGRVVCFAFAFSSTGKCLTLDPVAAGLRVDLLRSCLHPLQQAAAAPPDHRQSMDLD
jgi:hypothetical protein